MSCAIIKDKKKKEVISEEYCNSQFCLWLGFAIYMVHETILIQMA